MPAVEPVTMALRPVRSMIMLFSLAYWSSGLTWDFFHFDATEPRSIRSRAPCPCWRRPVLSVQLYPILENQAPPPIRFPLHNPPTSRTTAQFTRPEPKHHPK